MIFLRYTEFKCLWGLPDHQRPKRGYKLSLKFECLKILRWEIKPKE